MDWSHNSDFDTGLCNALRKKNDGIMERFGRAIIVVGMQFGSEGKGAITEYLSPIINIGARSGAANAGHTIHFKGQKFVMRQLPSSWINPNAKLVIGRGAIINLDVFFKEIELVNRFISVKGRIFIDGQAHVVTPSQIKREKATDLAKRIGSTSATAGEGIGMAMADKVLRKSSCVQAKNVRKLRRYITDTVDLINTTLDKDGVVLIEGTQGLGLSLEHGNFPYVTSRDTSATAIAASLGISTHLFDIEVIGVTRSYPIRVAGNSGSFGLDAKEISWKELEKRSGAKKSIQEMTSVTNKPRRIGEFSAKEFCKACQINRPTEIALTFADYLDSSSYEKPRIPNKVVAFIEDLETLSGGVPVMMVKTGPKTTIDFNCYRRIRLKQVGI